MVKVLCLQCGMNTIYFAITGSLPAHVGHNCETAVPRLITMDQRARGLGQEGRLPYEHLPSGPGRHVTSLTVMSKYRRSQSHMGDQ